MIVFALSYTMQIKNRSLTAPSNACQYFKHMMDSGYEASTATAGDIDTFQSRVSAHAHEALYAAVHLAFHSGDVFRTVPAIHAIIGMHTFCHVMPADHLAQSLPKAQACQAQHGRQETSTEKHTLQMLCIWCALFQSTYRRSGHKPDTTCLSGHDDWCHI